MNATSQALPTVVVELPLDGTPKRMLVVASDASPLSRPLFPFEVIGVFDPKGPPPFSGPDGFRQNGTFLDFLNWVIALEVPKLPAAQSSAKALSEGLLQIIDGRAAISLEDEPAPEDLLGHFIVEKGQIIPGTYKPSFTHRPLTENGLFELDPKLCGRILERIRAQIAHELGKSGQLKT